MVSGTAFHRAYQRATQQASLEAREHAFHQACGKEDSARPSARGDHARYRLSLALALRRCFLHAGGAAREGGHRGRGRLLPTRLLGPLAQARDLDALNAPLLDAYHDDERRHIAGRETTVGAAMIAERARLLPPAEQPFELAELRIRGSTGSVACECEPISTRSRRRPARRSRCGFIRVASRSAMRAA